MFLEVLLDKYFFIWGRIFFWWFFLGVGVLVFCMIFVGWWVGLYFKFIFLFLGEVLGLMVIWLFFFGFWWVLKVVGGVVIEIVSICYRNEVFFISLRRIEIF